MEAFQKAIELKADGIELDVQMTRDGQLVILHDETVNRVSDAQGWVKDYTCEELKKLNVNKEFPEYGIVQIPTLEEVYRLLKPTDLMINVELKNGIFPQDSQRKFALIGSIISVGACKKHDFC